MSPSPGLSFTSAPTANSQGHLRRPTTMPSATRRCTFSKRSSTATGSTAISASIGSMRRPARSQVTSSSRARYAMTYASVGITRVKTARTCASGGG